MKCPRHGSQPCPTCDGEDDASAVREAVSDGIPPMLEVPRSPHWRAVEAHVLANHKGGCSACGTPHQLQVHHCLPFHDDPARELDVTNLIVLCRACHFFVGHLCNWSSYNPTVVADAAAWRAKIEARPG